MDAPTVGSEMTAEHISKEKLMEDLRTVVVDAEELLKATSNQTGERVEAARIRAKESLRVARVRLAEVQATVVGKAKMAVKSTDHYVHDNPWQAMGIAAALGLAVGTLISRR